MVITSITKIRRVRLNLKKKCLTFNHLSLWWLAAIMKEIRHKIMQVTNLRDNTQIWDSHLLSFPNNQERIRSRWMISSLRNLTLSNQMLSIVILVVFLCLSKIVKKMMCNNHLSKIREIWITNINNQLYTSKCQLRYYFIIWRLRIKNKFQ